MPGLVPGIFLRRVKMKKVTATLLFFCINLTLLASRQYSVTADKAVSAEGVTISITMDLPKDVHVYKDLFFDIKEKNVEGLGKSKITLPPAKDYKDITGATTKVFEGKSTINISKPFTGKIDSNWNVEIDLQTQGCTDNLCFPPEIDSFKFAGKIAADLAKTPLPEIKTEVIEKTMTGASELKGLEAVLQEFDITKSESGYKTPEEFIAFLSDVKTEDKADGLAGLNFWMLIITILLGGLALNLTPCILPMIPINLGIIGAGIKSDSKLHGFLRGGYYGLGIALAYGALGLVAVMGGAKFGTLNSSPWFNFSIAAVFIILGLAILDVFMIDLSRFKSNKGAAKAKSGHFLPVFLLGAISALLAGACVAPVVIAVLLHSARLFSAGQTAALFLPFLLGIGMALPWPLAGAGMGILPKPGAWMSKVKVVFALFIFAFAAYYAYLGYTLLPKPNTTDPATEVRQLTENLQKAADNNKTVALDFWATWCKACIKMKKTTFKDPKVVNELKKFDFLLFQAEKPTDALIRGVQDKFGVQGLPTYVILKPKE